MQVMKNELGLYEKNGADLCVCCLWRADMFDDRCGIYAPGKHTTRYDNAIQYILYIYQCKSFGFL